MNRGCLYALDRVDGLFELAFECSLVVDVLEKVGGCDALLVQQRVARLTPLLGNPAPAMFRRVGKPATAGRGWLRRRRSVCTVV